MTKNLCARCYQTNLQVKDVLLLVVRHLFSYGLCTFTIFMANTEFSISSTKMHVLLIHHQLHDTPPVLWMFTFSSVEHDFTQILTKYQRLFLCKK